MLWNLALVEESWQLESRASEDRKNSAVMAVGVFAIIRA
jgi:hypothetical protein